MDFENVLRNRKMTIDAKNLDRDTRNSYIYLLGNRNSLGIQPWSISQLTRAFDCTYRTAKKWVELAVIQKENQGSEEIQR